ncbi:MAG: ABC transporter ATP-binding protein [Crocinitomicaceae bacterium]|jgi:lipoprotein-releasing system ATP-binding protein|nr:ABC transporter ATP-binding protein [Crocinitomicaceae bacterium]
MLQAKNIYKKYGNLEILKGIDIDVESGEIVSVVGSSGAGKTTFLQILGTLDKPDSGDILINNTNVSQLSDKKKAQFRNENLGFIFQFHQLLPEFTALENVMLPALIKGISKSDAKKEAEKYLDILGLLDRSAHQPAELSGGEQQRISVARALINQPKVIFADEPSGNLDSVNSDALHKLFFDLRDQFNHTFVIVTHNENLANMADRKLTMSDGLFI